MRKMIMLLWVFTATTHFAQSRPVVSLPFTVEKNCIYIYGTVNGSDSLKFLWDTGADGSVLNQESAHKVKLEIDGSSVNVGSNGQNEVKQSPQNEIVLGTMHKKDVSFMIIPFGTDVFDGIIGTDLMKDHIIEIDYKQQMIHFYAIGDKSIDYTGYTKLKLHMQDYPTYIESSVMIGNKKYAGLFGLDTGADDVLTIASPFAKEHDFIHKATKIGAAGFQGSDGSEYEMPIVLFPEIEFAGKHLYRIPAALSSATEGIDATDRLAGFYGNAFLKKFDIILDYHDQSIYFKLNGNLYKE